MPAKQRDRVRSIIRYLAGSVVRLVSCKEGLWSLEAG